MRRQAKSSLLCAALACAAAASVAFAEERREEFPILSDVPPRPEVFAAAPDAQARLYEEWVAALQAKRQALEAARLLSQEEAKR